jgi:hypothetical protein
MKCKTQTKAFAVRIKCKDGRRFLSSGEVGIAIFSKRADAKGWLNQLRPHLRRPTSMRVVRVSQKVEWEEAK